ncbi:MAG: site-specific DNA-methyltransferase, partial [Betaproteobacteria bacterium]|nr:site-specific DNA-methyltransferase [Betaproteobacteria bacterium]
MHALAKAALKPRLDPLFTAGMADAAEKLYLNEQCIPVYRGEFWTAMQRQAASIHEVSYRACFKPQLPAYFISRLTAPGDVVYDPFSGRGTTAVEAALL